MMGSKNWELKHWTEHSEVQWDWGRVGVRFDRFQYSHVQEAREIQGTWIVFWSSKILKVRRQPVSRWFVSWLVLSGYFNGFLKSRKRHLKQFGFHFRNPQLMKVRPAIDPLGGWVIKHQRMFFLVLPIAKWECVPSWLIKMGWTLLVLQVPGFLHGQVLFLAGFQQGNCSRLPRSGKDSSSNSPTVDANQSWNPCVLTQTNLEPPIQKVRDRKPSPAPDPRFGGNLCVLQLESPVLGWANVRPSFQLVPSADGINPPIRWGMFREFQSSKL